MHQDYSNKLPKFSVLLNRSTKDKNQISHFQEPHVNSKNNTCDMPTKRRGNYRGRRIKRKLKTKTQSGPRQTTITPYSWSGSRKFVPSIYRNFLPYNTREAIRRKYVKQNSRWNSLPRYPSSTPFQSGPRYPPTNYPAPIKRPWASFVKRPPPPLNYKPMYRSTFKQTPTRRSYNGYFYPVNRK
ncbi:hypothetical protein [Crucivirus-501]|nr:hypothetical protein [Crucivirus-501]QMW68999.1 hypothetical protein [Crucivirus-509]